MTPINENGAADGHGEKPGESGKPHGINVDGEHDPHSLSVRGWRLAGADLRNPSIAQRGENAGV
jgi:hypothetical protein